MVESPGLVVTSLGWQNEPDPTMRSLNPFTQARNLNGKRQNEIAEKLEVEPTEIVRLEQALFERVPRKIYEHYENELGMPESWRVGYRAFQRLLRTTGPRPIWGIQQTPTGDFTFRRWRIYNWPTISQMGWCKSFCIHPASLYAIEKGEQKMVPTSIITALIEAHIFSDEQARGFCSRIRAVK